MPVKILQRRDPVFDGHLPHLQNTSVRQIAASRGVSSYKELEYSLKHLLHYNKLKGIAIPLSLL